MESIKFQIKNEVVKSARLTLPLLFVLFGVLAAVDFLVIDIDWTGWDSLAGLMVAIAALIAAAASIRVFRYGSADQNFISLDEDSLVYTLWGHRRKWSWQELPSFQVTKGFLLGRPVIRFAVPDAADWRARLGLRPSVKVSSGRLVMLIGDIYNSPLDEIAARLNEFRDQAHSSTGPKSE